MSNLLFDAPGPRTRARHRLYSVVGALVLVALLGFLGWRMYDNGQLKYDVWEWAVTPVYVQFLLDGLGSTLTMAFSAIVGAVVLGLLAGTGKLSDHAWLRWPAWLVVEFFRAVPLLVLILFIFFSFGTGDGGIGSYWSVVIGLTLYNGAVLAEVVRAGVAALPSGQAEAAYALGLRKSLVMNLVVLPQAVKIMLPALISQCVVALKDTSLGAYVLAPGLTYAGQQVYRELPGTQVSVILVVIALYVAVNLLFTWCATWLQRRFVGEPGAGSPRVRTDQDTGRAAGLNVGA